MFLRDADQHQRVFRKTGAAIARAGIQELEPYPSIETHTLGYGTQIGADLLAQQRIDMTSGLDHSETAHTFVDQS